MSKAKKTTKRKATKRKTTKRKAAIRETTKRKATKRKAATAKARSARTRGARSYVAVDSRDTRYKIRFHESAAMNAAMAIEAVGCDVAVAHPKRCFLSLAQNPSVSEAEFHQELDHYVTEFGARVVEDYQYQLDMSDVFDSPNVGPDDSANPSLDEVLEMIRAQDAWQVSRGRNVIVAVVDTGIDGSRPEFPNWKRAGSWQAQGETPWTDWQGHGTMCACIAAGTRADGGVFNGVAPDASIIACKTRFYDSELAAIYDYLTDLAEEGKVIVATNSFGRKVGVPPPRPTNSDFIPAMDEAIAKGVKVVFSAGNNHRRAGGDPTDCHPNSVWLHKSRADVMAVATCRLDGSMWYYSSRGPGQFHGEPGTNRKPDVTAPTPRNGRVVYGSGIRSLAEGWGTSGACPQVAGLAALILAVRPHLTHEQVFAKICNAAVSLGHDEKCEGDGIIDCDATLKRIFSP